MNYSSLHSYTAKTTSGISPIERYKTCAITGQTKNRKPKTDPPKQKKIISYLNLFDKIKYRDDKTETGCSHVSPRCRKSTSTSQAKREREGNNIIFVEGRSAVFHAAGYVVHLGILSPQPKSIKI